MTINIEIYEIVGNIKKNVDLRFHLFPLMTIFIKIKARDADGISAAASRLKSLH